MLIAQHYEMAGENAKAAEHYLEAAEQASNQSWTNAVALYSRAVAAATESRPDIRARGLVRLGFAQERSDQAHLAKETLEQSLALARQVGDRSTEALALRYLGVVLGDLEANFEEGLVFCSGSYRIAQEIGDLEQMGMCRYNQMIGSALLGNMPQARTYCEEAISLLREVNALSGFALCQSIQSTMLAAAGELDQACQIGLESVEKARRLGEMDILATILQRVPMVERATGKFEAAIGHSQEAREIDNLIGNPWQSLKATISICAACCGAGHYEDIVPYLEEVRACISFSSEPSPSLWLHLLSALVAERSGRLQEARMELQAAVSALTQDPRLAPEMHSVVAVAALLLASEGAVTQAAELIGCLRGPSDMNPEAYWLVDMAELRLLPQMSSGDYQSAVARGAKLEQDAAVSVLTREFSRSESVSL